MVSAKANSARGFLQRNLTKCPLLYYNCVPNLEYTCAVWSPYHQHNVVKLERWSPDL